MSGLAVKQPQNGVSQTLCVWARPVGGAAILALLVWRLGAQGFLNGLRTINGWSLAAAAVIALVTTVSSAWRWSVVSRGLGVRVPLPQAIAAYYRSQFLNTVLPGGVLGDVHRAVGHGRAVGDVGRGVRAVAWERLAGQVVQIGAALVVLLVVASPIRSSIPVAVGVLVVGGLGAVLILRALPQSGPSRWARSLRAVRADIRDGLLAKNAWPGILLASVIVVAGHVAMFLVAARTAGATAPTLLLLPLTMLVMLAMVVPTNIGGWGPREGVAAWLFGIAGLGAAQGLATATVYGVMAFVATLPGGAVLVVAWWRAGRSAGAHDG
jgi:uncharacterized membrane protein YbhN (UPF0104 family)